MGNLRVVTVTRLSKKFAEQANLVMPEHVAFGTCRSIVIESSHPTRVLSSNKRLTINLIYLFPLSDIDVNSVRIVHAASLCFVDKHC